MNGGITKYKEAFLQDNGQEYPQAQKEILREALKKQMKVIERGLGLHASVCSPHMQGLQEKMEEFFEKMKAEIVSKQ